MTAFVSTGHSSESREGPSCGTKRHFAAAALMSASGSRSAISDFECASRSLQLHSLIRAQFHLRSALLLPSTRLVLPTLK